jgi:threonine dehydrogenase-like Zn-dependent dehydrogenase
VDIVDYRLEKAKEVGADVVLNVSTKESLYKAIMQETGQHNSLISSLFIHYSLILSLSRFPFSPFRNRQVKSLIRLFDNCICYSPFTIYCS